MTDGQLIACTTLDYNAGELHLIIRKPPSTPAHCARRIVLRSVVLSPPDPCIFISAGLQHDLVAHRHPCLHLKSLHVLSALSSFL